ncbi:UDP-glucose 4-epimerase GalE [Thioclava sp. L04-15]|uniref:UDP-glucose 4-epimerase GalE n=1 Tax=Thioclava sp. L04-15 TaxID=1915318 RepID=UPI000997882C|nr:UDP-glucose 4-epimerase GalE [Thioclava sp. L04-15]OOY27222.1 UDP-glucose 4-epimerase GalE [Thioclava sp. L04-15]TNE93355.1 MAG: UDP-glucose 4-epimerase GalE [Paracoccaceae bacterium]
MSKPKILVTGGAGYIGSHCCKALAKAGREPVVYDDLSRGHADAVRWGPLVVGDMRDRALLEKTLAEHRIGAVIHFAALAYVGESVGAPEHYYDVNLGGMTALLEAVEAVGIDKIVFSSSCATYGTPDRLPISEDLPQAPINPYGRTKLVCEWMLQDAQVAHRLRFAALRYFNAAGADPEGEIGERHDPETHLIPLVLMAASGQAGPVKIFGTDYPTPDGTCIRDYIHVDDLARAHLLALDHLEAGGESVKLNLGTGRGASIHEVVAAVERVTGRKVPHELAPRRPGDPAELTADPSKAAEVLGFTARYRDLDEIVAHAAPWFGL